MQPHCPCGSKLTYNHCCGLYIDQLKNAPTPEALMRSRFTAFTQANIGYIKDTMRSNALVGFDEQETEHWASRVRWIDLKIINTFPELLKEAQGFVEFIAAFDDVDGKRQAIHERSEFQLLDGKWYYTQGFIPAPTKTSKKMPVPRNSPCPCGSQKKYKNCHGRQS
ncbi:MAG: YchJ family metal-binding protein [Legionella sp.]|nr:YchJ family metal-binding protein [Legionella sp.]